MAPPTASMGYALSSAGRGVAAASSGRPPSAPSSGISPQAIPGIGYPLEFEERHVQSLLRTGGVTGEPGRLGIPSSGNPAVNEWPRQQPSHLGWAAGANANPIILVSCCPAASTRQILAPPCHDRIQSIRATPRIAPPAIRAVITNKA